PVALGVLHLLRSVNNIILTNQGEHYFVEQTYRRGLCPQSTATTPTSAGAGSHAGSRAAATQNSINAGLASAGTQPTNRRHRTLHANQRRDSFAGRTPRRR